MIWPSSGVFAKTWHLGWSESFGHHHGATRRPLEKAENVENTPEEGQNKVENSPEEGRPNRGKQPQKRVNIKCDFGILSVYCSPMVRASEWAGARAERKRVFSRVWNIEGFFEWK